MKKRVIFINSHPIQYFAPMYKLFNDRGLDTSCWYCSDESIKGSFDKEFGTNVKWDLPLLSGYNYKFFKNLWASSPARTGFFSLMNIGMVIEMFKIEKSILVIHGYHYFTHFMILMLGRMCGHKVCLRNDVPSSHEAFKKNWKSDLRKVALKHIVFPRIDYFLYVGQQNKQLYEQYGIKENQLLFCPYAVDNERFLKSQSNAPTSKDATKKALGIPENSKVILFSGKYIDKKKPLDLIHAFLGLQEQNCWLVMMGDGELRDIMLKTLETFSEKKYILTGFVNQTEVSKYYAISDVFVMCSTLGENWGLSVNEAMNFNLPLIVSDLTGCSDDLVKEGVNGYIFKTGDVEELTDKLRKVLCGKALSWERSSQEIVADYSYEACMKPFATINSTFA